MKILKKIFIVMIAFIFIILSFGNIVKADEQLILSDGTKMYYKGTTIAVEIPDSFEMQETYLRGVWVTPLAGCLPSCSNSSIETYKREIMEMFDVMEYYNLNCLIYHIRIFNDALYPSELNPKSSYMQTDTDLLPWVIEECHKRGIEFHAWLNPYRVKSSGGGTVEEEAAAIYAKCPNNVGSNPANLLRNSSGGVILNPGIPAVRDFIVDTCMEVIENYDVDAIHFDDYFYITDVDDSATREVYNTEGLSLDNFRRKQVDLFIEQLSNTMREYNKLHNRYVQLGISPSGIYRNGDGVVTYDVAGNAITNGSKTGGMQHWGNYLYSDTVNWINHEWIDYIMPQSYWAFSQPIAGFADVMSWWDKVCAYKNVNLYSGMGIYMSENPGSNYSWGFDPDEAPNQILYTQTLSHTAGTVFYNYNYLERAYLGDTTSLYGQGLAKIKATMFTSTAILPVIRTMGHVDISPVSNLTGEKVGNDVILKFNKVDNAKFYVVYRSEGEVTLDPKEVIAIFRAQDNNGVITYVDSGAATKEYNYVIRTQAGNNELSEPAYIGLAEYTVTFTDFDNNVLKTEIVKCGESATAPDAPVREAAFLGWGVDFSNVTSDLVVNAKYADSICIINYYNDLELIKTEEVYYGQDAIGVTPEKVGYNFVGWDKDLTNVTSDFNTFAIFEAKTIKVRFVDYNDTLIEEYEIKYGHQAWYIDDPVRKGYDFIGWDQSLENLTNDITLKAMYEPQYCTLTIISRIDNSEIGKIQVQAYTDAILPTPPEFTGFIFKGWIGDYENVKYDGKIFADYEEICYELTFYDINGEELETLDHYYVDDFTYPIAPAVDGLTFVKWSFDIKDLDNITTRIDIYPIYVKLNSKVTFVDSLGNTLKEVVLDSADCDLDYPETKVIENYTFVGWDKENASITEDTVITAVYKQLKVKFMANDQVIFEDYLTDGAYNKDYPKVIGITGYTFDHWDKTKISGALDDVTVNAILKQYKITFIGYNDKVILEDFLTDGSYANYPNVDIIVGYKLVGWDKEEIINQSSDVIVKAIYEEATVTVIYLDKDGKEFDREVVPYGGNAECDIVYPEYDGFTLIGWDKELTELIGITEDITIGLVYKQNKQSGCKSALIINFINLFTLCGIILVLKKKH